MFQELWIIREQKKDLCLHRAYILVVIKNNVHIFLVKFVSNKCFTVVLDLLYWKIKTNTPETKIKYLNEHVYKNWH